MAGITGLVSTLPSDFGRLMKEMIGPLQFSSRSRSECWNDSWAGLCRVRVGVDNPDPQPLFSRDKTKCIVLFGECFGYDDQRQQLIRGSGAFNLDNNDAEFILRYYEALGTKAFSQLSGSYCFAIYDMVHKELLLVSDRLGSRPLFYGILPDGKIGFSTQVASLLSIPGVSRSQDTAAAIEFCSLQRVLGDKTHHQGVRMLKPASVLRYSAGQVAITPYWYPDYRPQAGSVDEYAEELASIMRRVSAYIERDNARVAMLLSGGLDARMVVAGADNLTCYSFGDYNNPEVQAAKRIAKTRGFAFHFLERKPDYYPNMLDLGVEIGNGMHAFNHAHAVGFLEQIATEHDVVTHGFVPELLFRGHGLPTVPRKFLGLQAGRKLDPSLDKENLTDRILHRGYSLLDEGIESIFAPGIRKIFKETLLETSQQIIAETQGHTGNIYDQFLWPDVYYYARYPSMLFELSLRSFMTERSLVFFNEVIDLHLKMPLNIRFDNRVWLKAIARLNADVAHVTDANTGYRPDMPLAVLSGIEVSRKILAQAPLLWRLEKLGGTGRGHAKPGHSPHSYPRFDWMIRNTPRLRALVSETLTDPAALSPELFDLRKVNQILENHLSNQSHQRTVLLALLTFGRWHGKHGGR